MSRSGAAVVDGQRPVERENRGVTAGDVGVAGGGSSHNGIVYKNGHG